MVYENTAEQMAAAVPFVQQGLERNEQCVYIADDHSIQEVNRLLRKNGIDVDKHSSSGALGLVTKRDAYLKTGSFSPCEMVKMLEALTNESVARGYTGFRVTGEMTWALGSEHGCERLIEYEALLNNFFPSSRSLAICQYSRQRFAPEIIHDVLRTHPRAIIGDQVCPNLYYEPPQMILEKTSMAKKVDWMMQQLRRAREAEQKITRFNQELEKAVQQKTVSLEEAREQLETFCYSISHDLRAPLRSMQGFSALLLEEYSSDLKPEGANLLVRINEAGKRMQILIDDLLQFARINREDLVLGTVTLDALVTGIAEEVKEQNKGKPLQLLVQLPLGTVRAHAATLHVVLTNLLSNAIKFVAAGVDPCVELWSEKNARTVRLHVKDNGLGIAPDYHSKLFGIFERLNCGNHYPGSGMGLAIVKRGVERMSGTVGLNSEVGKGSTFWIELPAA